VQGSAIDARRAVVAGLFLLPLAGVRGKKRSAGYRRIPYAGYPCGQSENSLKRRSFEPGSRSCMGLWVPEWILRSGMRYMWLRCLATTLPLPAKLLLGTAVNPSYRYFARCITAASRGSPQSHAHDGPDTIFALSSGQGRSAVAVIRLTGPGAGKCCPGSRKESGVPVGSRLWPQQQAIHDSRCCLLAS
jgi:hypothetical protein